MGWKIGDIVNPEEEKHARQFQCSICYSVWDQPVDTSCCENTFCRACISSCVACPICRLPLGPVKECSKTVLRMLNNISVRCPYRSVSQPWPQTCGVVQSPQRPRSAEPAKAGAAVLAAGAEELDAVGGPSAKRARRTVKELDGCTWEGNYGDFLAKHLGDCQFHPVPCPLQCGQMVQRKDLAAHEETCENMFEKCSICGQLVKPKSMPGHCREAAELHVQLLLEMREQERAERAKSDHLLSGQVLERLNCLLGLRQHVTAMTRGRADDVKVEVQKQVRRHATRSVAWRIRGAIWEGSASEYLESPTFFIAGLELALLFFPHGASDAGPGCSTLGLSGDIQQALAVKYTINGKLSKEDRAVESGRYFVNWPKKDEIVKSMQDGCVEIEVEVLKISEVVTTMVRLVHHNEA